jgi:hypothetical protein
MRQSACRPVIRRRARAMQGEMAHFFGISGWSIARSPKISTDVRQNLGKTPFLYFENSLFTGHDRL